MTALVEWTSNLTSYSKYISKKQFVPLSTIFIADHLPYQQHPQAAHRPSCHIYRWFVEPSLVQPVPASTSSGHSKEKISPLINLFLTSRWMMAIVKSPTRNCCLKSNSPQHPLLLLSSQTQDQPFSLLSRVDHHPTGAKMIHEMFNFRAGEKLQR